MFVYIFIDIDMYVCEHVYTHYLRHMHSKYIYVYKCVHVYIYEYVFIFIYVETCLYICIYMPPYTGHPSFRYVKDDDDDVYLE
jgi:hypothetical protein